MVNPTMSLWLGTVPDSSALQKVLENGVSAEPSREVTEEDGIDIRVALISASKSDE